MCALAPSILVLNLGRVVQGVGAASMLPNSLALLNDAFAHDAAHRAKAVGWWTASGAIGLALGPVVGGLLLAALGWRWIFYVNLPACILGFVLSVHLPNRRPQRTVRGFDVAGQACAAVALTLLTAGIIELGHRGLAQPLTLGALAGPPNALTWQSLPGKVQSDSSSTQEIEASFLVGCRRKLGPAG